MRLSLLTNQFKDHRLYGVPNFTYIITPHTRNVKDIFGCFLAFPLRGRCRLCRRMRCSRSASGTYRLPKGRYRVACNISTCEAVISRLRRRRIKFSHKMFTIYILKLPSFFCKSLTNNSLYGTIIMSHCKIE